MDNFKFKDLFDFEKMITPKIIKGLYIFTLVIIAISSLIMIITGIGAYGGGAQVLMGIIFLIVSPLVARVYCELLIVIFKIYQKLCSIDSKLGKEKISE